MLENLFTPRLPLPMRLWLFLVVVLELLDLAFELNGDLDREFRVVAFMGDFWLEPPVDFAVVVLALALPLLLPRLFEFVVAVRLRSNPKSLSLDELSTTPPFAERAVETSLSVAESVMVTSKPTHYVLLLVPLPFQFQSQNIGSVTG